MLPRSRSYTRYFARLRSCCTRCPSARSARLRGTRQRSLGSRTMSLCMTCPTTAGSIPRRVVSTSGSSGIGTRWVHVGLLTVIETVGIAFTVGAPLSSPLSRHFLPCGGARCVSRFSLRHFESELLGLCGGDVPDDSGHLHARHALSAPRRHPPQPRPA